MPTRQKANCSETPLDAESLADVAAATSNAAAASNAAEASNAGEWEIHDGAQRAASDAWRAGSPKIDRRPAGARDD
jgi:hypothetical protein